MKIKLNRKRLFPSKSIKYLGTKTDVNLNWKQHIHDIAIKLNRASLLLCLLFTIRNYVHKHILRTISFVIFDSHINYANLMWGQNLNAVSRIVILQKKVLRTLNPLFKSNHILKLEDKILVENILFINNSFNNILLSVFKSWFTFCSDFLSYKVCHLLLTRYLNHLIELILTEKSQSL